MPVETNPNAVPFSNAVEFKDVETDKVHTVLVQHEHQGLSLLVPGYGTNDTEPGAGPVVLLEMRKGVPFLVVWADITTEEPTHTISLAGASERKRRPE